MITACVPSRGLVYSRTIASILPNTTDIRLTHSKPIPDCFNYFITAVDGDLWFVEEDIEVKPDTLHKLIDLDVDIATVNYNLEGGIDCVHKHASGYILGGTGCTLIKRHVFDRIGNFRADTEWNIDKLDSWTHKKDRVYGKHDVDFYLRAQQAGLTVGVLKEKVNHLRVKEWGENRTNVGWHLIKSL